MHFNILIKQLNNLIIEKNGVVVKLGTKVQETHGGEVVLRSLQTHENTRFIILNFF